MPIHQLRSPRPRTVVGLLLGLSLVTSLGCDKLPGRERKRPPKPAAQEPSTGNDDAGVGGGADDLPPAGDSDAGEPVDMGGVDAGSSDASEPNPGGDDAGVPDMPEPDAGGDDPDPPVPGTIRIEAEMFQLTEGVGYHDTDAANRGGQGLSNEGVDVGGANDPDDPGSLAIGYTRTGEWITYSFFVDATGEYTLRVRVAHETGGGEFSLDVDDKPLTTFSVPNTGGWASWQNVEKDIGELKEGAHTLKLSVLMDGPNNTDAGNISYFEFIPKAP